MTKFVANEILHASELNTMIDELDAKAPLSHTHETSEVTGLDTALAGKASSSHTHTTAQVTGLDTALAGKASSSHTHTTAQVTGLDTALAGKAASSHTHATSEVTGLDIALAGKAAFSHTHSEYASSTHTHSEYAAYSHTHSEYAALTHNHAITDVTNLQTTLGNKIENAIVFSSGSATLTITASNIIQYYQLGEVNSVTINASTSMPNASVYIEFTCGTSWVGISKDYNTVWYGSVPTFVAGQKYIIEIIRGYMTCKVNYSPYGTNLYYVLGLWTTNWTPGTTNIMTFDPILNKYTYEITLTEGYYYEGAGDNKDGFKIFSAAENKYYGANYQYEPSTATSTTLIENTINTKIHATPTGKHKFIWDANTHILNVVWPS